jgi:hypothetical protein
MYPAPKRCYSAENSRYWVVYQEGENKQNKNFELLLKYTFLDNLQSITRAPPIKPSVLWCDPPNPDEDSAYIIKLVLTRPIDVIKKRLLAINFDNVRFHAGQIEMFKCDIDKCKTILNK